MRGQLDAGAGDGAGRRPHALPRLLVRRRPPRPRRLAAARRPDAAGDADARRRRPGAAAGGRRRRREVRARLRVAGRRHHHYWWWRRGGRGRRCRRRRPPEDAAQPRPPRRRRGGAGDVCERPGADDAGGGPGAVRGARRRGGAPVSRAVPAVGVGAGREGRGDAVARGAGEGSVWPLPRGVRRGRSGGGLGDQRAPRGCRGERRAREREGERARGTRAVLVLVCKSAGRVPGQHTRSQRAHGPPLFLLQPVDPFK